MTHIPTNALSRALCYDMEVGSGMQNLVYQLDDNYKSTGLISVDWFGTSLLGEDSYYSTKGLKDLHIRNFEDLAKLKLEDSKVYLQRHVDRRATTVKLNHLLNFPSNIKSLINAKLLTAYAKRIVMAALIAKEIFLRVKSPKTPSNRSDINRIAINKDFIHKLPLVELVANKVVTKDSPLYLRELVAATHDSLLSLLGVDKGVLVSRSEPLFKQVYSNLSNMPISIELINQSSILDEFFVIDVNATQSNKLSVGVNPVPTLQRLPPLGEFLTECRKIIEIGDDVPVNDFVLNSNDWADTDPTYKGLPSKRFLSTNPLVGDLVNRNYEGSRHDQSISVSFPAHLEFLAKLMRERKIQFEACPRRPDHNYDPRGYTKWLGNYTKGRDSGGNVSLSIRINPMVENVLLIIGLSADSEMSAYNKLWVDTIARYLGTVENVNLALKAQSALRRFYNLIRSINGWTQKLVSSSLTEEDIILSKTAAVSQMLGSCKQVLENQEITAMSKPDPEMLVADYTVSHIGGFDFDLLHK